MSLNYLHQCKTLNFKIKNKTFRIYFEFIYISIFFLSMNNISVSLCKDIPLDFKVKSPEGLKHEMLCLSPFLYHLLILSRNTYLIFKYVITSRNKPVSRAVSFIFLTYLIMQRNPTHLQSP